MPPVSAADGDDKGGISRVRDAQRGIRRTFGMQKADYSRRNRGTSNLPLARGKAGSLRTDPNQSLERHCLEAFERQHIVGMDGWRFPCTCAVGFEGAQHMNCLLTRTAGAVALCAGLSAAGCAAKTAEILVRPDPPQYVIAVDDILTVAFWQEQIAPAEVVVRPDGKISLPLLNDVQAAGYTPEQLAATLEQAAAKYITEPNATVIVKEIRSRKVFVLGEIGSPGMVPLVGDMTVLQLIAVGGGLNEYADKKNIVIIRTEDGHEQRLKFNYNDVVNGKNVQQNILLQPGDTVVVNEAGVGIPLF
jgi:polysaccharide export outer membrane protein